MAMAIGLPRLERETEHNPDQDDEIARMAAALSVCSTDMVRMMSPAIGKIQSQHDRPAEILPVFLE
jgi:hypothetical protein